MLTADEDITTELDRVVCRLMKLALRTSRGRLTPPPTRWMQCKLLDMLTLTEKAIERRQQYFIENYPLRALDYDEDKRIENFTALDRIKADNTGNMIVDKYMHLAQSSVEKVSEKSAVHDTYIDLNFEKLNTSAEIINDVRRSATKVMFQETTYEVNLLEDGIDTKLERTQAWVEEDIEVIPYSKQEVKYDNSSGDTDHSTTQAVRHRYKKISKRPKIASNLKISGSKSHKHSENNNLHDDALIKIKPEEKNKDRVKQSKTKISKTESRKKLTSNNLLRNSKKVVSVNYGYYGIKNRRKKDHLRVIPTVAKPIPENLIELCHPELINEKHTEKSPSLMIEDIEIDRITTSSNVAATEKSFLIDIVTDELEETIALRRSIGTDAEDSTLDSETIIGSVSAVNVHSYSGTHKIPSENIQSQTIFLYDINEPTTSKGIRHTSMDVQCGPDETAPSYSVLSTTTSLTKIPKISTTGIKTGDSFTNVRFHYSEFGTTTNKSDTIYKTITPRMKSAGICIKDSDTHLTYNGTYSTVSKTISGSPTSFNVQDFSTVTETEVHKSISSFRMEESGSETYRGMASSLNFNNYSTKLCDVQSKSSACNDVEVVENVSTTKYGASRLCCGGVHVHSYKDKDISEDIVYQGEWQRYRSQSLPKRKPYIPLVMKKISVSDTVNKKLKVQTIKTIPEKISNKKELTVKNPPQLCNTRLIKINKGFVNKSNGNKITKVPTKFVQSTAKVNKSANDFSKVATKLKMSTLSSKNMNTTFGVKETIITPITSNKNQNRLEPPQKHTRKNYLPLYLRRNKSLSPMRNRYYGLNQNTIRIEKREKMTSHKPLLERSKTEEISTDLLKFRKELNKHVNYYVFRNELENNKNTSDDESTGNRDNALGGSRTMRPPNSLQSQTSSTCSSPNSIATVRVVSNRSKISPNKRHSIPSNKNNLASESENSTPNRNIKFYKRCQNAKRSDNVNLDNKENIPESSGKPGKTFLGRHKRIFMAQLADSSPLQSAINNASKHKAQVSTKSNIKIPTVDSSAQKKIPSPSNSKQRSKKSNISSAADVSHYAESKSFNNSINNSNLVLVVQQLQAEMVVSEIHKDSMILTSALESNSAAGNSLLAQWIDNKNVGDSQSSNILTSMRQLIEETLEFIDAPDNLTNDSETVLLTREDIKYPSLDISSSPDSFKTVIPNEEEYNNSSLLCDIEQALNRTFDTTSGDESILSTAATDAKLNANDLDVLSFKSLTTVSKVSEYYLADSELNNSQILTHSSRASSPKPTSVKDIFERKDQFMSQNPGGTFANQAFSGFSIDGEPVAGDQLDHVNLIDSETGSMAVDVTRQTTSEELFVSGRSSGSYESCLIDEDAMVPYWLFQIINQQQSVEEELPHELEDTLPVALALPMPMEEPMFDVNGNVMDDVAVGAGAGDGRGMHSDHSQDSSGRGTSLSSSDVSSGPQSEAVLIDQSAFAAQFELLREPAGASVVPINIAGGIPPGSHIAGVRNENEALSSSRVGPIRNPRLLQMAASDADVSSTDTDVPDSSSN